MASVNLFCILYFYRLRKVQIALQFFDKTFEKKLIILFTHKKQFIVLKLLLILLIPMAVFAQDISETQKLIAAADTITNVKNKVQLYSDIAWEYIITENDSALIYADKALQFSKKNKYPLGEAIALETKGLYHEIASGNYALASQFYFEGIAVCEANNLTYSSSIYHSLDVMFHNSDGYEKAL